MQTVLNINHAIFRNANSHRVCTVRKSLIFHLFTVKSDKISQNLVRVVTMWGRDLTKTSKLPPYLHLFTITLPQELVVTAAQYHILGLH